MLKFLLSNLLSGIQRNKIQSLVSILSLCLALTVFSLLYLFVRHELTWDRSWTDVDSIYRLLIEQETPGTGVSGIYDSTHHSVLGDLNDFFPGLIDKGARSKTNYATYTIEGERKAAPITTVDSDFFDIFDMEVVAGDLNYVIENPGTLAVAENIANQFLDESSIGQRILFENQEGGSHELTVGAIFRVPEHISNTFEFSMLTLLHESIAPLFTYQYMTQPDQWMDGTRIWFKFNPEFNINAISNQLTDFVDQNVPIFRNQLSADQKVSDFVRYKFQPITEMYMSPVTSFIVDNSGRLARALTFAVIAVLVLLVGSANFTSLSLAGVLERRREIGIRKSIGAQKRDILFMQLGEGLALTLLALIPTLLLVNILIIPFSGLINLTNLEKPDFFEYCSIALFALCVGILSSVYPAMKLAGTRPQSALKNSAISGLKSTLLLRNMIIGGQFALAIMLLIGTFGLYLQLSIAKSQPIGYDPENLILAFMRPEQRGTSTIPLKENLSQIPGVTGVDAINAIPNQNISAVNTRPYVRQEDQMNVVGIEPTSAGLHFFEMLKIPIVAGRAFDSDIDGYELTLQSAQEQRQKEGYASKTIISRRASTALGFESPQEAIGEIIYSRNENRLTQEITHFPQQIIGVAENNMYLSLRQRPTAVMYSRVIDDNSSTLMLKYDESIEDSIQESIAEVFEQVLGAPPSGFDYVENRIALEYIQAESENKILLLAAGLAIFLSCIGLYGLAAFVMERNIKEVGVRKVLGASVKSIMWLYLWRFSKPILVANLVAWPLAIYFILQWIERFPYQMEKYWLIPLCVGGAMLTFCIALVTVGALTVKAARANPVNSLRYE